MPVIWNSSRFAGCFPHCANTLVVPASDMTALHIGRLCQAALRAATDLAWLRGREHQRARFPLAPALVLFLLLQASSGSCADATILISEIMYHPASENPLEEYVELYNPGPTNVDLGGWRLGGGLSFSFPSNCVIEAGGYLVAAANRAAFVSRYGSISNLVGDWAVPQITYLRSTPLTNWPNTLSNTRNTVALDSAAGRQVNRVRYADRGDWAVRRRGYPSPLPSSVYRGWEWFKEHDGLGKSLELINPALPNEHGQNWAASLATNGTPGRPNSVASSNIAPLILEVQHRPVVPKSSEAVTVSARLLDESPASVTVWLHFRDDGTTPPPFSVTNMFDDGLHGDGLAGDGIYGAVLPSRPQSAIVEFYIEASDAAGKTRTWPAPAIETNGVVLGQRCNALYQVDDAEYAGDRPTYRLIMTASE
jgi:hypothetical protein